MSEQTPFQEWLRWNCKLQDRWERGVPSCDVEVSEVQLATFFNLLPSSPNNFDKHASHLAVGVSQERNNKFNDMSVVFLNRSPVETDDDVLQKLIWGVLHKVAFQVLPEAHLVCPEVCLPRHPGIFSNFFRQF